MNPFDQLVTDIMSHAGLDRPEATGFYAIHCPVCRENEKKTGGFKFEYDLIVYNCFRGKCDASCVYKTGQPISRKFKNLMQTIGVTIPVELRLVKSSFQKTMAELDKALYTPHKYKQCEIFPDNYEPLSEMEGFRADAWKERLEARKVPIGGFQFISDGKYRGNLLLPNMVNGVRTGYHIITERNYVLIGGGNDHTIYVPQGNIPHDVAIIVEGIMDAKCFPNTVATLSYKITPEQAYFLRHTKRVILIPDRSGGNTFIEMFHRYKWEICIPPWEEKDLNGAVMKYGVFAAARMIRENIYTDKLKANMAYKLWNQDVNRRQNQ